MTRTRRGAVRETAAPYSVGQEDENTATLTKEEVGEILGVGPQYVYDLHTEKKLIGELISPRKLRFSLAAVRDFQARQAEKQAARAGEGSEATPAPNGAGNSTPNPDKRPETSIPDLQQLREARDLALRTIKSAGTLTKPQMSQRLEQIAQIIATAGGIEA